MNAGDYSVETDLTQEQALGALATASELWGGRWRRQGSGGLLELPVLAGLRRGVAAGRVWIEPAASGSRVVFRVDESHYRLHWTAFGILVMGALGGIAATLWPFYPPLLGVAPLAVVLALAAWFLVASRLRTSGVEDFLELVASNPSPEPAAASPAEVLRP